MPPQTPGHPLRIGPEWEFHSRDPFSTSPYIYGVTPVSVRASGGASLTIVGNNFFLNGTGGGVSVTIDGVAATSVVVVDAQHITCVVPALPGVGRVDLAVTTPGGTATARGAITSFEATIVSLTPAFGTFAGGTRVLISGFNFLQGMHYTVLFGGVPATNVTVVDSQHVVCTTPANAVGFADVVLQGPSYVFAPNAFQHNVFQEGAVTPTVYASLRRAFQFTLLTRGADFRRQPGIQITKSLGQTGNTATITIDGTSNSPQVGELIEVTDPFDSDRLLFRGTLQSYDMTYEGQTDQLVYTARCVDFTYLLNKYFPVGTYTNVSVSTVVTDLVSKFAPGFTAVHVQTNLAMVSVTLDGSQSFSQVLTGLGAAIGGGHWYVDDEQDIHFFHVVPTATVPPSEMQALSAGPTLAQSADPISSAANFFTTCYAWVRQTFVYSDGTESQFSSISNAVLLDGLHRVLISNIAVGPPVGLLTCVKRRIYVNILLPVNATGAILPGIPPTPSSASGAPSQSLFEFVQQYAEIDDNTTTSFESDFAYVNPSTTAVVPMDSTLPIPVEQFNGHPTAPLTPITATAHTLTLPGSTGAMGGAFQFKVAYLYRDGSVSFPGPASATVGINPLVIGMFISGFDLTNIPIGPSIGTNDVVARIVYWCLGADSKPGASVNGVLPDGFVWPYPQLDPDWINDVSRSVILVPDNTTTLLSLVSLAPLGYNLYGPGSVQPAGYTPLAVGEGNSPANDSSILSADPIPVWPNADGPSLENVDPPDPINDSNTGVYHEDSGATKLLFTKDISQLRNRVKVIGSGSVTAVDAPAGSTSVQVNDITAFSPAGGQVRLTNLLTGLIQVKKYTGIAGVTGQTYLVLSSPLLYDVPQGSFVVNFFQADNVASQRAMGQIELDKNGKPTDGVHETTITDSSLKAAWQLYMRANAELELFSQPIVTIVYATPDPKSTIGQTVHFDLTNPPIKGDFLIQQVVTDQVHDESDQLSPRYTVTCSSTKYLLTDLLLALISGTGGGGPSAAGIVATGALLGATDAGDGIATIPSSLPASAGGLRRWSNAVSNGAGIDTLNQGITIGVNVSGASSNVIDASRVGGIKSGWTRYQPFNNNANQDGWQTVATATWDNKPLFAFRFRTANLLDGRAAGALNDRVYWFGLANGLPTPGSESFTNLHVALFCSTKFSDGVANFEISVGIGGLQARSNVGFMQMQPSTHYVGMVKWVGDATALVALKDLTHGLQGYATVPLTNFLGSATTLQGIIQSTTGGLVGSNSYLDISSAYMEED